MHDPADCMMCQHNKQNKGNYKGHKWYKRPRKRPLLRPWEGCMQKPTRGAAGVAVTPAKGDVWRDLPHMWGYMTDDKYDDGTPRVRSSILIFADGGVWKAWLNDRAESRNAWGQGETLEAALADLEERIATGVIAWREGDSARRAKK